MTLFQIRPPPLGMLRIIDEGGIVVRQGYFAGLACDEPPHKCFTAEGGVVFMMQVEITKPSQVTGSFRGGAGGIQDAASAGSPESLSQRKVRAFQVAGESSGIATGAVLTIMTARRKVRYRRRERHVCWSKVIGGGPSVPKDHGSVDVTSIPGEPKPNNGRDPAQYMRR
jgi:hypothetical protein